MLVIIYNPSGGVRRHFRGRLAQILGRLIDNGPDGLTAAELPPGVRLAAYIQRLRRAGVPIETAREACRGPWGGNFARYVLNGRVERVEVSQ